jgi:hypothetical protein
MSDITLSPNHGVNPSMLFCPVCGKDTGVALHGRLPGDKEAPKRTPDRVPCGPCKAQFDADRKLAFLFFILRDEFEEHKAAKGATPWHFFYGLIGVKKTSPVLRNLEPETRADGVCFISFSLAKQFGLVLPDGTLGSPR